MHHTQIIENLKINKAVLPDIVLDSDPQSEVSVNLRIQASKVSTGWQGKEFRLLHKPGVEVESQLSSDNTSQPMSLDSPPLSENINNASVSRTDQHSEAKTICRPTQFTGEIGELRSVYELLIELDDAKHDALQRDALSYMSVEIVSPSAMLTPETLSLLKPAQEYRHIFSSYPAFNTIQSHVLEDVLYSDQALVVSAPTGSGKTVIFELAIVRLLMKVKDRKMTENFKIIYMAPVKALCSERFQDWSEKFSSVGLRCQEITGDSYDSQVEDLLNFNLLFTTPEKWDSLTRKWRQNKRLVGVVKLFLLDEVHLVSDEKRGPTLEAVVSRMKTVEETMEYTRRDAHHSDINIRFVAVSATIPNIEDVSAWLGNSVHPAINKMFGEEFRPVKLKQVVLGFYSPPGQSAYLFEMKLNYKLREILFQYAETKPSLIFCSTRKGVLQTAETLTQQITFRFNEDQKEKLFLSARNLMDKKLEGFVMAGVGAHHAGMTVTDRRIMEDLFRRSLLPVLVTTSTLAMGVNLPAHLVVVKSTQQYVAGVYQDYSDSQLLQMIGRAGRPQFDTSATAVIMTKEQDRPRYLRLVSGSQLLESSLHRHLGEHLNSEIVLGTISDKFIAMNWMRSTFLYVRACKNPQHYGIAGQLSKCEIENRLQDLVMRELNILARANLINMDDIMDLKSTEAGKLMASFYMSVKTMECFNGITGDESLENMVSLVASCHDFTDMQLRRVEKKTLNELNRAKNRECIRFPLKGLVQNSAMKVNVLIQATLGCLPLHDHSLHQDVVSIMRVGERVTKCLVKYLFQRNNYRSLLNAAILAKCFYAKLWENSLYVSRQLKRIGPIYSAQLASAGKTTFKSIIEANPRDLERILNKPPPLGNELKDAAIHLPKYNAQVDLDSSQSNAVVTIVLENLESVSEYNTAGPHHWLTLIVGDSGNKIRVKERFKDEFLIQMGGCHKWNIDLDASVHKIHVNLISDHWVGIDVNIDTEIAKSKEKQRQETMKQAIEKYISKRDLLKNNTGNLSGHNMNNKTHDKPKKLTVTEKIKTLADRIPDLGVKRLVYDSTPTLKQTNLDTFLYTPIQRKKLPPWKEPTTESSTTTSNSVDGSFMKYNSSCNMEMITKPRKTEVTNWKSRQDSESDVEWIESTPPTNVMLCINEKTNNIYTQNNPTDYTTSMPLAPHNVTKYSLKTPSKNDSTKMHLDEFYRISKVGTRRSEKSGLQYEYNKEEDNFLKTTEFSELNPTPIVQDKTFPNPTNSRDQNKIANNLHYFEDKWVNSKPIPPSVGENLVRKGHMYLENETNIMQNNMLNEKQSNSNEFEDEVFEGNLAETPTDSLQESRSLPLAQDGLRANAKCHTVPAISQIVNRDKCHSVSEDINTPRHTIDAREDNQRESIFNQSHSVRWVTDSHTSGKRNLIDFYEIREPITDKIQEEILTSRASNVTLPGEVEQLQHRHLMLPSQGIGVGAKHRNVSNSDDRQQDLNQPATQLGREETSYHRMTDERSSENLLTHGQFLSSPKTMDEFKIKNSSNLLESDLKITTAMSKGQEIGPAVRDIIEISQQFEEPSMGVGHCSKSNSTLAIARELLQPQRDSMEPLQRYKSQSENMLKLQLSENKQDDCLDFENRITWKSNATMQSLSKKQLQETKLCTSSLGKNCQKMSEKEDSDGKDMKELSSMRMEQRKNIHPLKTYYPIFFIKENTCGYFSKNSESSSSEQKFPKTCAQSGATDSLSSRKDDLKLNVNTDKPIGDNFSDMGLQQSSYNSVYQMPKVNFDLGLDTLLQTESIKENNLTSCSDLEIRSDLPFSQKWPSFQQQSAIKNFKLPKIKWDSKDKVSLPVMKLLYGSTSPPNDLQLPEKLDGVLHGESIEVSNSQKSSCENQKLSSTFIKDKQTPLMPSLVSAQSVRIDTLSNSSSTEQSQLFCNTRKVLKNYGNETKRLHTTQFPTEKPQEMCETVTRPVHFLKTYDVFEDNMSHKAQSYVTCTQEHPQTLPQSSCPKDSHLDNANDSSTEEENSCFIESTSFCNIARFDEKAIDEKEQSFPNISHELCSDEDYRCRNLSCPFSDVKPKEDTLSVIESQHQGSSPSFGSVTSQDTIRRTSQCCSVECLEDRTANVDDLSFPGSPDTFQFLPRDHHQVENYHSHNETQHTRAQSCIGMFQNPTQRHNVREETHRSAEETGDYRPCFLKCNREQKTATRRRKHDRHLPSDVLPVCNQFSCFDDDDEQSGHEEYETVCLDSSGEDITSPRLCCEQATNQRIGDEREFVKNKSPISNNKRTWCSKNNAVTSCEREYFHPDSDVYNNKYTSERGFPQPFSTDYNNPIGGTISSPNTNESGKRSPANVKTSRVKTTHDCHPQTADKSAPVLAEINYHRADIESDVTPLGQCADEDHMEPLQKRTKLQPETEAGIPCESKFSICTVSQYFQQLQDTQRSNSMADAKHIQPVGENIARGRENSKLIHCVNKSEIKQNKLFPYCRKMTPIFEDTNFKKSKKKRFW